MTSSDSSTPTLFKLGLFAFVLTILTGAVWSVLLLVNLRATPAIPWAPLVMALMLWLAWRALSATPKRRARLRAVRVPVPVFVWALIAGLLSITALAGLWIVLMQLVRVHGNVLPSFSRFPIYTVVLVIAMASIATAVAEEAGFRGYFQGAMEPRFGPRIAIFVAALIMEPGHGLTQGLFDVTTIMFYYCVDIMLGWIAYLTQSIVPGIVVHAIGLAVFFSLVWPFDATRRFIPTDGADLEFWIHVTQIVVAGALALVAFKRLAQMTAAQRVSAAVQA